MYLSIYLCSCSARHHHSDGFWCYLSLPCISWQQSGRSDNVSQFIGHPAPTSLLQTDPASSHMEPTYASSIRDGWPEGTTVPSSETNPVHRRLEQANRRLKVTSQQTLLTNAATLLCRMKLLVSCSPDWLACLVIVLFWCCKGLVWIEVSQWQKETGFDQHVPSSERKNGVDKSGGVGESRIIGSVSCWKWLSDDGIAVENIINIL